jgi:hypothetical protein
MTRLKAKALLDCVSDLVNPPLKSQVNPFHERICNIMLFLMVDCIWLTLFLSHSLTLDLTRL